MKDEPKTRGFVYVDDTSGHDAVRDEAFARRFAGRTLVIGAPWPGNDFFKHAKGSTTRGSSHKLVKIKAEAK